MARAGTLARAGAVFVNGKLAERPADQASGAGIPPPADVGKVVAEAA